MKDLICLAADNNMVAAMDELLNRHVALGIRRISFDVQAHPRRDIDVLREGVEFVRPLQNQYQHGLRLLDGAWDGAPPDIHEQLNRRLADASLDNWARAIVIAPELEVWAWSDSPHLAEVLGWSSLSELRSWLGQNGLWDNGESKPQDPKTAMERAVEQVRKPRSSVIYRRLAKRVSVRRCKDPAFVYLQKTLLEWFT